MPNMTLSIPDDLHAYIKKHPEISWSAIARAAMADYAHKVAWMDEMLKDSKLTEKDVEQIGRKIKKGILRQHLERRGDSSSTRT